MGEQSGSPQIGRTPRAPLYCRVLSPAAPRSGGSTGSVNLRLEETKPPVPFAASMKTRPELDRCDQVLPQQHGARSGTRLPARGVQYRTVGSCSQRVGGASRPGRAQRRGGRIHEPRPELLSGGGHVWSYLGNFPNSHSRICVLLRQELGPLCSTRWSPQVGAAGPQLSPVGAEKSTHERSAGALSGPSAWGAGYTSTHIQARAPATPLCWPPPVCAR